MVPLFSMLTGFGSMMQILALWKRLKKAFSRGIWSLLVEGDPLWLFIGQ